jgi:hypothetical protein
MWANLKQILEIPCSKFFHLGHIVREASNSIQPKSGYFTESARCQQGKGMAVVITVYLTQLQPGHLERQRTVPG